MNIPPRDKLMQLLAVYGITTYQSFYDRVLNFKEHLTPRDELSELAGRLPDDKVQVLLGLAQALAEGRAIVAL